MTDLRIGLLNTADEPARPWRNFRREIDADLVEYHVRVGDLPPPADLRDLDGVVVTGSPASVYSEQPWIQAAMHWVKTAVESGIPHLGVCFGHQLVAAALGGTVEPMGETELGYRMIRHHGGRLFSGIQDEFVAFTSHSDTVTKLPPGAQCIAENDFGVQGFRDGHVYGVQFHPEYDPRTAREIAQRKDLPRERIQAVMQAISRPKYRTQVPATQVFDNFLAYVAEVRERGFEASSQLVGQEGRADDGSQVEPAERGAPPAASDPYTNRDGEPR